MTLLIAALVRRLPRVSPWFAVAAGLACAPLVVRLLLEPGSVPFFVGRAVVYAAVGVALAAAWWCGAIARGGWRLVLLPCAAAALYRAVWEGLRLSRPDPPLWFLAAGVALAGWLIVAAARGVVRELRSGAAGAAT